MNFAAPAVPEFVLTATPGTRDCSSSATMVYGWGETYAQGSTRRTLIIDRELLGPDGKVVLVGYVYPSQIAAWPADPGDDTVNEAILRGELPDEATFIPDRWGQLP